MESKDEEVPVSFFLRSATFAGPDTSCNVFVAEQTGGSLPPSINLTSDALVVRTRPHGFHDYRLILRRNDVIEWFSEEIT